MDAFHLILTPVPSWFATGTQNRTVRAGKKLYPAACHTSTWRRMDANDQTQETTPHSVGDWLEAVVQAPSRWDLALALIPVALSFGVLLGGTPLPMWAGVGLGTAVAVAAAGYVLIADTPG